MLVNLRWKACDYFSTLHAKTACNKLHMKPRHQYKKAISKYKKHLKNVGPIRHCEPPHAACFTLPFTRCRYCRTPPAHRCPRQQRRRQQQRQRQRVTRGDRYGPMEWAQSVLAPHGGETADIDMELRNDAVTISLCDEIFTSVRRIGL